MLIAHYALNICSVNRSTQMHLLEIYSYLGEKKKQEDKRRFTFFHDALFSVFSSKVLYKFLIKIR